MNLIRLARRRRCDACEHRRTAHAGVAPWPMCVFDATEIVSGVQGPGSGVEPQALTPSSPQATSISLSDFYLDGPESNCPAGYWTGLAPVDPAADAAQMREHMLKIQRSMLKPLIGAALKHIPSALDRASFLVETVRAHGVLPEIADELAAEAGVPADTNPNPEPPRDAAA